MIQFEYFLKTKEVKKCSSDVELAKSLIKDMRERVKKSFLLDENVFAKMVFENIYDGLRDFCDALLALAGFKSYSHQASIAYLSKEGFDVSVIEEFDQFRYKRNGSKYYGQMIMSEDAKSMKEFYSRIKIKIDKIIKNKGLE
jgi:hypothetical protein